MIALPFHPSNAYTIREFNENLEDILHAVDETTMAQLELKTKPESLVSKIRNGKFYADQGVIAGCSGGTYQNMMQAAAILNGQPLGSGEFWLSVYPTSQPVTLALAKNGALTKMMASGASLRSSFCGPCFGAGDVPANGGFSIRHSTRNFPNREGSKPNDGQVAYVALMDARSIAASALNGGAITSAMDLPEPPADPSYVEYEFDRTPYDARVYFGVGKPDPAQELVFGPNIADWPAQIALPDNLLLDVASAIYDPVTTTDELIPSGETSSYRSNPLKLAEFTLSRKDPAYVGRANAVAARDAARKDGTLDAESAALIEGCGGTLENTGIGSVIFANKPGDGSAREQAASCQRVLGGCANLCYEYATKRYRSNCINWGMLPFHIDADVKFDYEPGDRIFVPHVRAAVGSGAKDVPATVIRKDGTKLPLLLHLPELTADERQILLDGCLMNYYAANHAKENA